MLYRFDDFLLDPGRRELWRGAFAVEVGPQVFDLLTYLVQNRERVVSQDDLLAAIWKGRIVSELTLRSHINAVRTAVGDNGEDQRLIRTVPRKGFRFVGAMTEDALPSPTGRNVAAPLELPVAESIAEPPATVPPGNPNRREPALPAQHQNPAITVLQRFSTASKIAAVGAGLAAAITLLLIVSTYWRPAAETPPLAELRQLFDPAVIPLIADADRRDLATYSTLPGFKALAIAAQGWGMASGASDLESAKSEALKRCGTRAKSGICKIFASGMDVVWSPEWVPMALAADLHTEPLDEPLRAADLTLTAASRARVEQFKNQAEHKALALSARSFFAHAGSTDRAEAVRLALERCGEHYQAPCMVVSVDGMLTVRIPKSRRVTGTFLLTTATDMTNEEKLRIADIYRQTDWRALVRGKSGNWYAVANAPSEEAAIDAALQSCAGNDAQCRLHAIGNFRVASTGEEPVP